MTKFMAAQGPTPAWPASFTIRCLRRCSFTERATYQYGIHMIGMNSKNMFSHVVLFSKKRSKAIPSSMNSTQCTVTFCSYRIRCRKIFFAHFNLYVVVQCVLLHELISPIHNSCRFLLLVSGCSGKT